MATVTQTTTTRKAYFAHMYDEPGMLFQHTDGRIMFLNEHNDQVTLITPDMVNFLTVLGEVALANDQRLADLVNGGYAKIATSRTA